MTSVGTVATQRSQGKERDVPVTETVQAPPPLRPPRTVRRRPLTTVQRARILPPLPRSRTLPQRTSVPGRNSGGSRALRIRSNGHVARTVQDLMTPRVRRPSTLHPGHRPPSLVGVHNPPRVRTRVTVHGTACTRRTVGNRTGDKLTPPLAPGVLSLTPPTPTLGLPERDRTQRAMSRGHRDKDFRKKERDPHVTDSTPGHRRTDHPSRRSSLRRRPKRHETCRTRSPTTPASAVVVGSGLRRRPVKAEGGRLEPKRGSDAAARPAHDGRGSGTGGGHAGVVGPVRGLRLKDVGSFPREGEGRLAGEGTSESDSRI